MPEAEKFPLVVRSSLLTLSVVDLLKEGGGENQSVIMEYISAMYEEDISLDLLDRILRYLMHRDMVRVQPGPNTWAVTEYGQQALRYYRDNRKHLFEVGMSS